MSDKVTVTDDAEREPSKVINSLGGLQAETMGMAHAMIKARVTPGIQQLICTAGKIACMDVDSDNRAVHDAASEFLVRLFDVNSDNRAVHDAASEFLVRLFDADKVGTSDGEETRTSPKQKTASMGDVEIVEVGAQPAKRTARN